MTTEGEINRLQAYGHYNPYTGPMYNHVAPLLDDTYNSTYMDTPIYESSYGLAAAAAPGNKPEKSNFGKYAPYVVGAIGAAAAAAYGAKRYSDLSGLYNFEGESRTPTNDNQSYGYHPIGELSYGEETYNIFKPPRYGRPSKYSPSQGYEYLKSYMKRNVGSYPSAAVSETYSLPRRRTTRTRETFIEPSEKLVRTHELKY